MQTYCGTPLVGMNSPGWPPRISWVAPPNNRMTRWSLQYSTWKTVECYVIVGNNNYRRQLVKSSSTSTVFSDTPGSFPYRSTMDNGRDRFGCQRIAQGISR